jgi:hypothetical protein
MAIVKLTAAKSPEEASLSIPSVPITPPVRSPSPEDLKLRSDALVPSTLNLIDIEIPDFGRLDGIMSICSRYRWNRPEDVINANYDQVAADLTGLTVMIIECAGIESKIGLAYENAVSNRDTVHDYHYSRLRAEANQAYAVQNADYIQKLAAKPERMTDTEIKARVSLMISALGYPGLINKLKSAKSQTSNIISRAENKLNTLKKLIDRAQRHGG